jgi:LPXTG-site transpeptidase (sortase) family protein
MYYQSTLKKIFFLTVFIFFLPVFYFSFNVTQTDTRNIGVATTNHIPHVISIVSTVPVAFAAPMNSINTAPLKVGKPVQLMIPSINVNAKIEHIGLTATGNVGVPAEARDVSWFDVGPRPGQKGSAVISGHFGRWKNGTDSVFNLLPNLKPGDTIYVKDDNGATIPFVVKKMLVYNKDQTVPEIFNKTDHAYLNIITCHGNYIENQHTYSQRLVVFAQLKIS